MDRHLSMTEGTRRFMAGVMLSISAPLMAAATSPLTTVDAVYETASGGNIYVMFTDNINDGCSNGQSWKVMPTSVTNKDDQLSLILTAFASGSKVYYYVDGCNGPYPALTGIQITKE